MKNKKTLSVTQNQDFRESCVTKISQKLAVGYINSLSLAEFVFKNIATFNEFGG